jgi:hypothetical protein
MELLNSFILNFSIVILYNIFIFDLLCFAKILLDKLNMKSQDTFKFYIYNWYLTLFYVFFYISFFIIFFYYIRILNLNQEINLKQFFLIIYNLVKISLLPLYIKFFIFIFIFILLINASLFFLIIHKHFLDHIFILYFYFRYHENLPREYKTKILMLGCQEDIITYYIGNISYKITKYLRPNYKYKDLPKYHFKVLINKIIYNKYYTLFVSLSPFFIILYDCIFNHWVITHVFYYLIVFIPVMIWKRITTSIARDASFLCQGIWDLYYKKETALYAISPLHKKVLDIYISTNLRVNIDLGLEPEMYLRDAMAFYPDIDEVNGYRNSEGTFIKKMPDNRIVRERMSDDGLTDVYEEWILLVEKMDISKKEKHKVLVFF